MTTAPPGEAGVTRLSLRRDPVRLLFSPVPWAASWYLLGYLFVGTILFAVVVYAAAIAVTLSFTLIGLILLAVVPLAIQACADVERVRLRTVYAEPVRGRYREPAEPTWLARLRTRWSDPALWRDLAYLFAAFAPLFVLDTAVLYIWLALFAGVTSPAWYQHVSGACVGYCPTGAKGIQLGSFPHGPHGSGAVGLYVATLPSALILAAVCLVAFLIFTYVVVATARLHAATARALLGAHGDPLREAKEVLRRPGPLSTFIHLSRTTTID